MYRSSRSSSSLQETSGKPLRHRPRRLARPGQAELAVAGVAFEARRRAIVAQVGQAEAPGARVVVGLALQHAAGGQAFQQPVERDAVDVQPPRL